MSESADSDQDRSLQHFGQYRVEHLFLLIGSNPVPNAVAARLLLKPHGTLTLLHSRDTESLADRLIAMFQKLPRLDVGNCRKKYVEEWDSRSVLGGVKAELGAVQAASRGLHYTGGTKAMSVHAYRALEHWAKKQPSNPPREKSRVVYSYLDARQLAIIVDPNGIDSSDGAIRIPATLKDIGWRLDDLLQVHGWARPQLTTQPRMPKTARALQDLHSNRYHADSWSRWLENVYELGTLQLPQLEASSLPWPVEETLKTVREALQSELSHPEANPDAFNVSSAAMQAGFLRGRNKADVEKFCEWLKANWLESAVLATLEGIKDDCSLHSLGMNLRPLADVGPTNFELDVVALRSYQLFVFSCSTMSDLDTGRRQKLKLKLFEAVIRARQIGGDEACVALICRSEDPDNLQNEVRATFGGGTERIKVFGRPHLKNLSVPLRHWINAQSGYTT